MYDLSRILEDATGLDVAEYIGMPIQKRGSNYFTYCPSHMDRMGKRDHVAKNCVITHKGCKCFACGAEDNVVQMVLDYYKNELQTPISFPEALGLIADSLGGRRYYLVNENQEENQIFRLKGEDYQIICLKQTYYYQAIKNAGKTQSEVNAGQDNLNWKKSDDFDKTGLYLYYEDEKITMTQLLRECPKLYWTIICEYAKKASEKYKEAIYNYCDRNSPKIRTIIKCSKDGIIDDHFLNALQNDLQKKYDRAYEIYQEADSILADYEDVKENKKDKKKDETQKVIDYFSMF